MTRLGSRSDWDLQLDSQRRRPLEIDAAGAAAVDGYAAGAAGYVVVVLFSPLSGYMGVSRQ